MTERNYQHLISDIETGEIEKVSPEILRKYLSILCKNSQQIPKSEDIVMGITINHVSMKKHINHLDKQNRCTQKWFMIFAAITLFASLTQIYYARKADILSAQTLQYNTTQQQMLGTRWSNPYQMKLPSSHRIIVKSSSTNVSSPNPTLNQTTNSGSDLDKVRVNKQ